MTNRFAVVVTLNGATLILSTHASPREAAEELAIGRSSRWANAFVIAR